MKDFLYQVIIILFLQVLLALIKKDTNRKDQYPTKQFVDITYLGNTYIYIISKFIYFTTTLFLF